MTQEEKLNYMRIMGDLQDENDEALSPYLTLAKEKLLNHIYPYRDDKVELEKRYEMKQVELAIVLFNKKGAEGESSHSENGVARKYMSEDEILQTIPRHIGIPK